jgi:hypothetical protein
LFEFNALTIQFAAGRIRRGGRVNDFTESNYDSGANGAEAPLAWFPRLLRARPKQRANWRLIGRGIGIHWDDVDEDISVRTLLAAS